jgi:hypothetical protein
LIEASVHGSVVDAIQAGWIPVASRACAFGVRRTGVPPLPNVSSKIQAIVAVRRLAVLLPLGLAACAGTGSATDPEELVYPAGYRNDTIAFLRTYLNDPANVREASISEPVLRTSAGRTRYVACVRYNAKDTTGRYTGAKTRVAVFHLGRFDSFLETARDLCDAATYMPFPDLERLTR